MTQASSAPNVPFFTRCWRGEARLWQAFWLVGVLGTPLVIAVVVALGVWLMRDPTFRGIIDIWLMSLMLGYLVFVSVSIWRCAPNTDSQPLGGIARVLVVFAAGGWILAAIRAVS